jgi:hypothetical protein
MQAEAGLVRNGVIENGLRKRHPVGYNGMVTTFISIVGKEGWLSGI